MAKIKTTKSVPETKAPRHRHSSSAIGSLEELLTNKQSPIDTKQIAYHFMREIGGSAGFVQLVMIEYNSSQVGSLARSRVLDIMLKLFQLASPTESAGDLATVSDDDLMRIFQEKLGTPPPAPQAPKPAESWITDVCI